LSVLTGAVIRFIFRGIEVIFACRSLAIHIARRSRVTTASTQSFFEELNQPVDQSLLPADDMKSTFVAMLL